MKSAVSSVPDFTKLTNGQLQYMQISYTGFHQNRSMNMEFTDTNLFAPIYEVWLTDPLVTKLTLARQCDMKNSYIEFPENLSHVLVSDTVSQKDDLTNVISTQGTPLSVVKEAYELTSKCMFL
jgi:hypothetical protein